MTAYDCIFLGSSPGVMLESVIAARAGLRTAIVSSSSAFGGSWFGMDVLSERDVECAPHFFQSAVDLGFLAHDLRFELIDVPRTRWIVDLKFTRVTLGDRGAKIFVQLFEIARALRSNVRNRIAQVSDDRIDTTAAAIKELAFLLGPYRESTVYFRGGCLPALRAMQTLSQESGVAFVTGVAERLRGSNGTLEIQLASGAQLVTRKLCITRRSVLEQVEDGDSIRPLTKFALYRNQLHLRVRSETPITDYLVRSAGLRFFALSNLSLIENVASSAEEYFLTLTLADMREPIGDDYDVGDCVSHLKLVGALPPSARLIESHVSCYPDIRLTDEDYTFLQSAFPGRVEMVGVLDLARWIESMEPRWIQKA